ncbi:YadA C-terminal domain-containing protein [Photobacterium swingsii]|nr:YadA C-terminal domain-containing protein [Photobacterium swingsii]
MKKSIIALSLASLFTAGSALAAINPNGDFDYSLTYDEVKSSGFDIKRDGKGGHVLVNSENKVVAKVDTHGHKGDFTVTSKASVVKYDARTGKGTIENKSSGDVETFKFVEKHNIPDLPDVDNQDRNNDQNNHYVERANSVAQEIAKQVKAGKTVKVGDVEFNRANIKEISEIYNDMTPEQKKAAFEYAINNKVDVKEDDFNPRPDDNVTPDVREDIERTKAKMDAAAKVVEKEYARTTAKIEDNTKRIDGLEKNFSDMAARQDRMEDRMNKNEGKMSNGVAGVAAMANIPTVAGKFTVGAGMGHFNGSTAIAIGASNSFDNGISVKGSMAYAQGKFSQKDMVVGAGVGYSF